MNALKKSSLIIFGVLLALLLLQGALYATGHALFYYQTHTHKSPTNNANYTVLAMGESTTQGAAENGIEETYPFQLEKILQKKCENDKISVINLGLSGTNTQIIANDFSKNILHYNPNLVITMMGINDVSIANKEHPLARISQNLQLVNFFYWIQPILQKYKTIIYSSATILPTDSPEIIVKKINQGSTFDGKKFAQQFSQVLMNRGNINRSLELHREVTRTQPNHAWAQLEIGNLLRMSGNYTEAILTHQKALNSLGKTSEDYYWFLYELALDYAQINDWNLVYQTIKKSENKEVNSVLYAELFLTAKKNKEAHAFITEKLKFFPNSPRLNDMLSSLEKEKGTLKKNFYFNSRTLFEDLSESRESYEKFIRIASAANIPLLVMQYPTRALSPLLKMLQGVPMQQVYFLSNEAVFVDALQQKNYQELFYDHFGGSFGHLTKYGNFLLAENISKYLMTSHLLPKNICNH